LEQWLNDGKLVSRDQGLYRITCVFEDGRAFCSAILLSNSLIRAQIGHLFEHVVKHGLDLGNDIVAQFVGVTEGGLNARNQSIGRHHATASRPASGRRAASGRGVGGILREQRRTAGEQSARSQRRD
jgi:hypothetical protein